jgi:hypothetical protein
VPQEKTVCGATQEEIRPGARGKKQPGTVRDQPLFRGLERARSPPRNLPETVVDTTPP